MRRRLRAEHAAYVAALEEAGVAVTVLEPLEDFPDSVFVEDPALILNGVAIVAAPRRAQPGRGGRTPFARRWRRIATGVLELEAGLVDGGDILCTDDRVMVGLSARTDRAGVAALTPLVERWAIGWSWSKPRPRSCISRPSAGFWTRRPCSPPRVSPRRDASGRMHVIETAEGEDAAANAIAVNGRVFLSAGHPGTAERLRDAGFAVVELPTPRPRWSMGGSAACRCATAGRGNMIRKLLDGPLKGFPDLPPVWLIGFMAAAWLIDRGLPLVEAFGPVYQVAGGLLMLAALGLIAWSASGSGARKRRSSRTTPPPP
jgi:dimethylargininase